MPPLSKFYFLNVKLHSYMVKGSTDNVVATFVFLSVVSCLLWLQNLLPLGKNKIDLDLKKR